jgi:lipoprotein-releasing system ATP-binding protein
MPDLVVENVTKEYPTRAEPLVVLKGASFGLSAGENLAILGPSGSGKSTLLYLIGTLDQPSSGQIRLQGEDITKLSEPQLARLRNERIGFVFQDHHLLPQCSVLENVLLPTIANGAATRPAIDRGKMLLARVGLSQRLDHRPAELSGGERQRAAIARALIRQPILVLADEPTGNLDRTNAAAVGQLLLEMQRSENAMLVVVTHSQELADRFGRRIEIDDGRLVER